MQPYPTIQNYSNYQPMTQPYADRLAQLQSYQQSINPPQMQAPTPQVNQGLLWVSGEVGAKSYLVAPNSTVLLMDSDAQRFYLKSADNSGMPSLRVFEYTEVTNVPQNAPQGSNLDENVLNGKYVTRQEYECLKRQYEIILNKIDTLSEKDNAPKTAKSKAKGVTSDEQSDI